MISLGIQLVSRFFIKGMSMMNFMGLLQWAVIGQFAVYFMTYALDLYGVLMWENTPRTTRCPMVPLPKTE